MEIKKIKVGNLETNCYILTLNNKQLVIDPGAEYKKIKPHLNNPVAALITHYHFDHIEALEELKNDYDIKLIDYKNEGINEIEDFKFEVIKFPGHHETCVMFKFNNDAFVGDFVFKGTIGRTDLETGNYEVMLDSLEKLKQYNDLNLYCGHGDDTTLNYEKKTNPYLKK